MATFNGGAGTRNGVYEWTGVIATFENGGIVVYFTQFGERKGEFPG